MTTKQQLSEEIASLQNDIAKLQEALTAILVAAKSPDYSASPSLEKSPAYLLGAIQALCRNSTWFLSSNVVNSDFASKMAEIYTADTSIKLEAV